MQVWCSIGSTNRAAVVAGIVINVKIKLDIGEMMFYTKKQRANLIAKKARDDAEIAGLAPGPAREVGHYAKLLVMSGESGWRSIAAAKGMINWLSMAFAIDPVMRGEDLTQEEIEIAVLARADEYARVRMGDRTWRS